MNRMIVPIWFGVILGSLVVAYLGMVIATPHFTPRVQSVEATLVTRLDPPASGPASAAPAASGSPADCSLHAAFPEPVRRWCGTIEDNAARQQLDPNLVAAVMTRESGGDSSAYSSSGAVGLLQIMPSDGLAASFYCDTGPCFASRPLTQQLLDPQFNISYGTKMLSGLLKRYGSVREALRAYGPMDVGYSYADKVLSIYAQN